MDEILQGIGLAMLGAGFVKGGLAAHQSLRSRRGITARETLELEAFRENACLALAKVRSERPESGTGWQGWRKFYVARKVKEARNVSSLYLKPHDGKTVPIFVPGQHLTVQMAIPDEPRPVTRCYSLSDAPLRSDRYRLTIKRLEGESRDEADGLVSSFVHDSLREGSTIALRAPSGRFYLDFTTERPVVLIAGGIGLTPLLSMLNAIAAFRQPSEAWLFYGIRNRHEHAFRKEQNRAIQRHGQIRQVVCYSQPTRYCVQGRDYHHKGRVDLNLLKSALPHKDFVFYLCGPGLMMETLTRDLLDWGVAEENIRTEAFGASTVKVRSTALVPLAGDLEVGPKVTFARSKTTANWNSQCKVLLDLAEGSGVNLYTGCRAGQCGSCMVSIGQGKVRHIVEPGMPLGENYCLPCVAVPEGPLVLDA